MSSFEFGGFPIYGSKSKNQTLFLKGGGGEKEISCMEREKFKFYKREVLCLFFFPLHLFMSSSFADCVSPRIHWGLYVHHHIRRSSRHQRRGGGERDGKGFFSSNRKDTFDSTVLSIL